MFTIWRGAQVSTTPRPSVTAPTKEMKFFFFADISRFIDSRSHRRRYLTYVQTVTPHATDFACGCACPVILSGACD
eukprot:6216890-Pyramimonas_sp.AAC.1